MIELPPYDFWNYLGLILNAVVGFGAVYYGIQMGNRNERRKLNREYDEKVRKIVPHLYFELCQNEKLMNRYGKYELLLRNNLRFRTSIWDMFKTDLAQWEEHDIIPLTRIYYIFTKVNSYLDTNREQIPTNFRRYIVSAELMIKNKINAYDTWFLGNNEARNEFVETLQEYRTYLTETDERDLLNDTEVRLREKGVLPNE